MASIGDGVGRGPSTQGQGQPAIAEDHGAANGQTAIPQESPKRAPAQTGEAFLGGVQAQSTPSMPLPAASPLTQRRVSSLTSPKEGGDEHAVEVASAVPEINNLVAVVPVDDSHAGFVYLTKPNRDIYKMLIDDSHAKVVAAPTYATATSELASSDVLSAEQKKGLDLDEIYRDQVARSLNHSSKLGSIDLTDLPKSQAIEPTAAGPHPEISQAVTLYATPVVLMEGILNVTTQATDRAYSFDSYVLPKPKDGEISWVRLPLAFNEKSSAKFAFTENLTKGEVIYVTQEYEHSNSQAPTSCTLYRGRDLEKALQTDQNRTLTNLDFLFDRRLDDLRSHPIVMIRANGSMESDEASIILERDTEEIGNPWMIAVDQLPYHPSKSKDVFYIGNTEGATLQEASRPDLAGLEIESANKIIQFEEVLDAKAQSLLKHTVIAQSKNGLLKFAFEGIDHSQPSQTLPIELEIGPASYSDIFFDRKMEAVKKAFTKALGATDYKSLEDFIKENCSLYRYAGAAEPKSLGDFIEKFNKELLQCGLKDKISVEDFLVSPVENNDKFNLEMPFKKASPDLSVQVNFQKGLGAVDDNFFTYQHSDFLKVVDMLQQSFSRSGGKDANSLSEEQKYYFQLLALEMLANEAVSASVEKKSKMKYLKGYHPRIVPAALLYNGLPLTFVEEVGRWLLRDARDLIGAFDASSSVGGIIDDQIQAVRARRNREDYFPYASDASFLGRYETPGQHLPGFGPISNPSQASFEPAVDPVAIANRGELPMSVHQGQLQHVVELRGQMKFLNIIQFNLLKSGQRSQERYESIVDDGFAPHRIMSGAFSRLSEDQKSCLRDCEHIVAFIEGVKTIQPLFLEADTAKELAINYAKAYIKDVNACDTTTVEGKKKYIVLTQLYESGVFANYLHDVLNQLPLKFQDESDYKVKSSQASGWIQDAVSAFDKAIRGERGIF